MPNVSHPTSSGHGQAGQRNESSKPTSVGKTVEKDDSLASSAMHSAEEAASYVSKKADDGLHAVGSGLKSFGDNVRNVAPRSGIAKDGLSAVANTLQNTGKYLEEEGLSGIAEDMIKVVKRNPIPAMFIGMGIGFLLGRTLSSRS
ncbi:MAG: hypothetical protein IAF94_14480 [Pirellulaceae bacterium]|nr:hypothetical protein [Pirellulaceae bacterium]